MARVKLIRQHMGLTQAEMATALSTVQGNITTYENGRALPEKRAHLLIQFAETRGLVLTYDHIYGDLPLPEVVSVNQEPAHA